MDGTISVLDVARSKFLHHLEGHFMPVRSPPPLVDIVFFGLFFKVFKKQVSHIGHGLRTGIEFSET